MWLKEMSVELRDRIVLWDRSAALKVPKKTEASWPLGQTGQSGEKSLGQGGDQVPDGHSDRALEFLC